MGSAALEHTQALRTALTERYAAATVNRCLATLRGVLRECFNLGLMDADTLQRASTLPAVKAATLPKGRALGNSEIRAMFAACLDDTTSAGVRDAALFAVLYGAGLRRAELVGLDLADDTPDGGVRVRKGNKDRVTTFHRRYAPSWGAGRPYAAHRMGRCSAGC